MFSTKYEYLNVFRNLLDLWKNAKSLPLNKLLLQAKYTFVNGLVEDYNKISHTVMLNKIIDTKMHTFAKPIYLICKQLKKNMYHFESKMFWSIFIYNFIFHDYNGYYS